MTPILQRCMATNNFYSFPAVGHPDSADEATMKVYKLITENADVVKGIFCGDYHNAHYTEILASYVDVDGKKQDTVIPQYVTEALVYDEYVGHVLEITVE